MLSRRHILSGLLTLPVLASPAFANGAPVFSAGGLAINGIDPISYFTKGAPVVGQARHRLKWHGATWQFESAQSRDMFERNPYALSPQYGGYCAMSLVNGTLSPSTPDAWTMHEGKLYLTQSIAARDLWRRDSSAHVARSDAHWPTVICR